jgi:hypothetical protein
MDEKPITYQTIDVPVIDGVATLPDGRLVKSSAKVVRVPYLTPEDEQRLAEAINGPFSDDSLDAAWAEAEAALPEYALLRVQRIPGWKFYEQEQCEARIEWWKGLDRPVESAFGDTPAAALRALAAKLREVGR